VDGTVRVDSRRVGGALFSDSGGELELLGIISTVSGDLRTNGIVDLQSIVGLLEHRSSHTYPVPLVNTATEAARVGHS
jgi:hypothetical protein